MSSSSGVYPYMRRMYFGDGPDPMCRSMQSTWYPRFSAAESMEIVRLLDWDISVSESEFVCTCAGVWRGWNKLVDVGIDGAGDTRLMNTILCISFLSIVMEWDCTLIKRKGPSVGPNNLLQRWNVKDDALLFFVFLSAGFAMNIISRGLFAGVSEMRQT